MKNLSTLILVMALCLGITTLKAGNTGNDKNSIAKKIQKNLSTPDVVKNKNKSEKITVYFSVNAEGNVIEVNAKTSNAQIKQHLEKEFLTLNLQGLKPCVTNTIDINYVIY